MFTLIKADGSVEKREEMRFNEMQDFVGGYVEVVGNIICNEDGGLLGLPVNKKHSNFVGNIIIGDIRDVKREVNSNDKI